MWSILQFGIPYHHLKTSYKNMADLLFPYYVQPPVLNWMVTQMMMILKVVFSFAQNVEVQLSSNLQSGICHWVMMGTDPQNLSFVDEVGKMQQVGKDKCAQDMRWWEGMK